MLRAVKVGGWCVGAGLAVGLGVVGYMYATRPADDESMASTRAGSVALDTSSPTPTPAPKAGELGVTSPETVAASGAGAQQLVGFGGVAQTTGGRSGGSESNAGSGATPMPAAQLPGPDQFGQYETYREAKSGYFGDVVVGSGKDVAAGSKVTVNYRGWLTNGTLFDESYSKGQPFTFTEGAGQVIPGWEQTLFGMKVGGKRRLIIPPAVGYGDKAVGSIPANSLLVFDVELVGVQ